MPLPSRVRSAARVEPREHQVGELLAGDPAQGLVGVDQALVGHVDGDPERRLRGALADPGLEHPELAALDGELDVAHVAVVALERGHDPQQLVVRGPVDLGHVGQRHGVADAGDDVLALGVLQVVAVHALVPARGVPGERDAGAGGHAPVAEDHGLDVDRGAEVLGDPLLAAVQHGAVGVPGVEDRGDGEVQLLARVLGELPTGVVADHLLEGLPPGRGGPRTSRSRSSTVPLLVLQPRRARRRSARRRCPGRCCRTSGAADGRSPSRTARRRSASRVPRSTRR